MNTATRSVTREEFHAMPGARALRFSYDWFQWGRYTYWIENVANFGWSVVCDYGKPGVGDVVTSPRTYDACAAELTNYIKPGRAFGGPNLTVDEYDED